MDGQRRVVREKDIGRWAKELKIAGGAIEGKTVEGIQDAPLHFASPVPEKGQVDGIHTGTRSRESGTNRIRRRKPDSTFSGIHDALRRIKRLQRGQLLKERIVE
jgi:hypothetical protein